MWDTLTAHPEVSGPSACLKSRYFLHGGDHMKEIGHVQLEDSRTKGAFRGVLLATVALLLIGCAEYRHRKTPPSASGKSAERAVPPSEHPERVGVTIFLRHQQSKSLDELLRSLKSRKFYRSFPPDGVEVLRWDVVMGIGQVVTVLARPADVRKVNTVIEKRAWGSFDTEFYPTYVPAEPGVSTVPQTEGITNENYVLFTAIVEDATDPDRNETGRESPALRSFIEQNEDVGVETVRQLIGHGTLYTFRVPPDRVASLDRMLERRSAGTTDLEVYTSYNFLPIHRKITGSKQDD